jgi:co-chaperonin GroES (HSP10)
MRIKPLGSFVMCKEFEPEVQEKRLELIVPSGCAKRGEYPSVFGEIVDIGKDVKLFKIGDKVIYAKQQGHFVKLGLEECRLIPEDEIVGMLKK